jgi:ATP-dependent helicase/nuclease subunit A
VFATRFPALATPQTPEFAPLEPHREPPRAPALFTLTTPAAVDSRDVAAHEAACIARYIRTEVDAGRRAFGDFLILTRRKKGLRPYARALESLQVPIEVSGAGAFGDSEEVRALALLLHALADPQDAIALVGVLRGPLFGLSDRALFAFRQSGGWFGVGGDGTRHRANPQGIEPTEVDRGETRPLPLFDSTPDPVAAALEAIGQYYRWTRMLPPGAALERILEHTGYLALAAATPGGVEAGDLLHAVDRVRAVIDSGLTLADAADALGSWSDLDADGRREESSEVDSLPLEPGRGDVVRLMNLHKAKGLEAAVVFLADPMGGFAPRVDVRILRPPAGDPGPPVGFLKITSGDFGQIVVAQPADWDDHERAESGYLAAEGDRLLYVAATRACDMLVVGRHAKPGGASAKRAWQLFEPFLQEAKELAIPGDASVPQAATSGLAVAALNDAVAAATAAHDRARAASWSIASVTAEVKHLPRQTAEAADADDPTRVLVADTAARRADAGAAWGTLIHGLLEHALRHRDATRDDLRRLALWLTIDELQLRPAIEQALDTVDAVARAPFWQESRAAAECHEEVPFAVRDDDGAVPHVLTGAIDVVYRAGGEWRIVDYKTDVAGARDSAAYAQQLGRYSRVWPKFGGGRVEARIIEARAGRKPSSR